MTKLHRRNFLSKLTLGITSFLAFPSVGNTKEQEDTVLKVKPLGFQWETMDPFLFCVHHEDAFPKGNDQLGPAQSLDGRDIGRDFMVKDGWRMYYGDVVPGFPSHPHRGFETITVVRKGMVDHADSIGAAGRYGDGDVQWMTAGKGVQHSEMFPLLSKDKENPMELFQIWLNLPRKNKLVNPHYMMMWRESIPIHTHKDSLGNTSKIEIIVGKLFGKSAPTPPPDSWAFPAENNVGIWNIKMEPNAEITIPATSNDTNRSVYFYEGSDINIAGKNIRHYHAVEVRANHDLRIKNSNQDAGLLVLQGKPIDEPVVQAGPFVMNSKEEIKQAYADFQQTRFGGWPWEKSGQVHKSTDGRFAQYADGRRVVKS